jgi:ankyrin repeat protein
VFPNPQAALPLPKQASTAMYRTWARQLREARGATRAWVSRWVEHLVRLAELGEPDTRPFSVRGWVDEVDLFATRHLATRRSIAAARLVIARSHGFASWDKLMAHIEGSQSFERAAETIVAGDLAGLRALLAAEPALIRARSGREHNATLLHYVSANGVEGYRQATPANIVEIATVLLDAGAEVDAEADVYGGGATTLALTATSVHPEKAGVQIELLQLLLDRGARLEDRLLDSCLANGQPRAAEFLRSKGARLDLQAAAGLGLVDEVRRLLPGSDAVGAYFMACWYGQTKVVEALLASGVAVDALDKDGRNGLHCAAFGPHVALIHLLLEHGGEVNWKENQFDATPLDVALWRWDQLERKTDACYDAVTALVRAGAVLDPHHWRHSEMLAKIAADARMGKALEGLAQ